MALRDGIRRRPRVLLVDDYAGLLTALTRLLAPSCDVVGHVLDGATLGDAVTRLQPDVVVLDVSMPRISGLEACRQIKSATPDTKVVILTAFDDAAIKQRAFGVGASAFVLKSRLSDDLLPAIEQAFNGESETL